ncbi:MAG: hypothetical protein Q9222_001836 [Ikaeria aurantiellina]
MFLIEDSRKAILYTGDIRDDYKLLLYSSTTSSPMSTPASTEGAALCGFLFGNHTQTGCLTSNESVRLHSCERGSKCSTIEKSSSVVWITPLINRSDDGDFPELGAGGGGGDLTQTHELELSDTQAVKELIELCKKQLGDDQSLAAALHLVAEALLSQRQTVALDAYDPSLTENTMPIESLARLLYETAKQKNCFEQSERMPLANLSQISPKAVKAGRLLPRSVKFPYSRHSSYDELCHLLSMFKPKDLYPCVTDEATWTQQTSMKSLFGHVCSGTSFSYDDNMRAKLNGGSADNAKGIDRQQPGLPAKIDSAVLDPLSLSSDNDFDGGRPWLQTARTKAMKLHSKSEDSETRPNSGSQGLRKKTRTGIYDTRKALAERKEDPGLALSFAGWLDGRSKEPIPSYDQSNPPIPRTEREPVELLSSSGSEIESDAGGGNKVGSGDPNSGSISQRSAIGTSLSQSKLGFKPQEHGLFAHEKLGGTKSERDRYREEIYEAIIDDDGFVWGRDCGLLSSTVGCEDDDEL